MRRTVLFPPSTAWPSPAAFFASCRIRLLQAYGIPANVSARDSGRLTARCKLTKGSSRSCKFRVDAVLLDGVWVLDEEKCVWEHSHYAGEERVESGEEDEAYSLAVESVAMPRTRKKGPIPPLEEPLSEADNAGSSSDFRNERDAQSDEEVKKGTEPRKSRRTVQSVTVPAQQAQPAPPLVPGLPLPGDRFSSFKAFYQATPLSVGQKPKKLLTSGKENNGDLQMRKVLPLPPTPRRPGLRSTTRARAPPFPSFAKPAFRQAVFAPRLPSARLTKDYGVRKKSIAVKPDTASDSSSFPSSPPSSEIASPSDGAPLIPAPSPRSLQPSHLTAFFTALHPALALLGPVYFAAGFSTPDSLVDLALFDWRTVEELLDVRGSSGEDRGVEKPEVRRRWVQLVVEELKGAREET